MEKTDFFGKSQNKREYERKGSSEKGVKNPQNMAGILRKKQNLKLKCIK